LILYDIKKTIIYRKMLLNLHPQKIFIEEGGGGLNIVMRLKFYHIIEKYLLFIIKTI
jgi:hypothetical protein